MKSAVCPTPIEGVFSSTIKSSPRRVQLNRKALVYAVDG